MNYRGKYGKYYEVPEAVIRVLFDSEGNKRLDGRTIRFSEKDMLERPNILEEAFSILETFNEDFSKNTGAPQSPKAERTRVEDDNCWEYEEAITLPWNDMILDYLIECQIPIAEINRIYKGIYIYKNDDTVSAFMKNHYDDDTEVEIVCANGLDKIKCRNADVNGELEEELNKILYDYYVDNGYKDKTLKIFAKGLRITKRINELAWGYVYQH